MGQNPGKTRDFGDTTPLRWFLALFLAKEENFLIDAVAFLFDFVLN